MKRQTRQEWILLIHQLPPRPTNLRVRIWRKLQKLGAIAIKNSVYVLPANERTHEDFQWLKQEIETADGEAAVFCAGSVAGTTDGEIIAAFCKARDEEFAIITADLDGLAGAIREQAKARPISAGRLTAHEAELDRLHAELERVGRNDFFNAKSSAAARKAYERCQQLIRATHSPTGNASSAGAKRRTLDPSDFQGRRWVTRANLHIDRLASAWLIKQFIDKRPRFYFTADNQGLEGAISFDMVDGEFTHQGEDCTFETMLKKFGLLGIKGLRELAEIVHDIDLKDEKFHRLEAAGLNAIINGLSETLREDRKLLKQTGIVFDGLFALLQGKESKRKGRRRNQSKVSPKKVKRA